jgi:hypothetical protein
MSEGLSPEDLANLSDKYLEDMIKNLRRGSKFGVGRDSRNRMGGLLDKLLEEQRRRASSPGRDT